jgi:hypothetical protein
LEDIFAYLKRLSNKGITFRRGNCKLIEYSDSDWTGDCSDRKLISEYIFLFNNGLISWSLKKQKCGALLSAETEYVALVITGQETIYFKQIINIFLFKKLIHSSIIIMEDN